MRRSAFTLIESLIAIIISVVVLSAVIAINRVVAKNAQQGEQLVQMNSLAEEALENFKLLKDTLPVGFTLKDQKLLSFTSSNSSIDGTFIANWSGCSQGNCNGNNASNSQAPLPISATAVNN